MEECSGNCIISAELSRAILIHWSAAQEDSIGKNQSDTVTPKAKIQLNLLRQQHQQWSQHECYSSKFSIF